MPTSRKIATAATFAIVIIDIGIGIAKQVSIFVDTFEANADKSYEQMAVVCNYLEPTLAVTVCALPVYRVLLPSSRRQRSYDRDQLRVNAVPIKESTQSKRPVAASAETIEEYSLLVREPKTAHFL